MIRVGDPDPTPNLDDATAYCWAPVRLLGQRSTRYCSWPQEHDGDHVSADEGRGVVAVYAGTDLPAGRVWAPRDRRPWVVGPDSMGLTPEAWTDAMAAEGAATGVNRQCSIGWHRECSDPAGESCKCACHPTPAGDDDLVGDDLVEVPLGALRDLVGQADAWRSTVDQNFACSDEEREESDVRFAELVDALGLPDVDGEG